MAGDAATEDVCAGEVRQRRCRALWRRRARGLGLVVLGMLVGKPITATGRGSPRAKNAPDERQDRTSAMPARSNSAATGHVIDGLDESPPYVRMDPRD